MSTHDHVWVNLLHEDGSMPIPLKPNKHGELPVLLIDPPDGKGRIVLGSWLARRDDDAALTTCYERLSPVPYHAVRT